MMDNKQRTTTAERAFGKPIKVYFATGLNEIYVSESTYMPDADRVADWVYEKLKEHYSHLPPRLVVKLNRMVREKCLRQDLTPPEVSIEIGLFFEVEKNLPEPGDEVTVDLDVCGDRTITGWRT